uniref:Uncharacterized protein n=1 Tax=Meloidogyne incognita TaxID=6306 RepID=A0A914KUR0_MELIC
MDWSFTVHGLLQDPFLLVCVRELRCRVPSCTLPIQQLAQKLYVEQEHTSLLQLALSVFKAGLEDFKLFTLLLDGLLCLNVGTVETTFHLNSQCLEFSQCAMSTIFSITSGSICFFKSGLEFTDFSSQTSILEVELMKFTVSIG